MKLRLLVCALVFSVFTAPLYAQNGALIPVAFNANDYTAIHALGWPATWVVKEQDVRVMSYTMVAEKLMLVVWDIGYTSVTGGPTALVFPIPAGKIAATSVHGVFQGQQGVFLLTSHVQTITGSPSVLLLRNAGFQGSSTWSSELTHVRGQLLIEIQ